MKLPGVEGNEIELSMHEGDHTLVVDGQPAFGSISDLERPEHVARARRLDGETWEVRFDPL